MTSVWAKLLIYFQILIMWFMLFTYPRYFGMIDNLDEMLANLAALYILTEVDNIMGNLLEIEILSFNSKVIQS